MINKDNTQNQSGETFSRLRITDLDALLKEVIQVFEPGVLAKGASHQIVAPYESGKTFLSFICAKEFLQNGLKVLYLDYENRPSCTKERLDAIGTTIQDRANLLYVSNPDLDLSADAKEQWVAFLKQEAPDLIIFDSLIGFLGNAGTDENSSTGFQEWANVYLQIARAMGITTLVIDHTGWDGNHSRGTSRKPGEFDIIWNVKVKKKFSRTQIGEVQLNVTKDKDHLLSVHKLNFVLGGTPFKFEKVKTSDSSEDELSNGQKNTLDLIVENSRNENGTPRKSVNELFNGSKSNADTAIKVLLEKNLIHQKEGSRLYWASDSLDSSVARSPESPDNNSDSDTNSDSLENGVKGKGSKGPGPLGPDLGTLSPTEIGNLKIENLKEFIESILARIDNLDLPRRGTEVVKAVASVYLNDPNLTQLLRSEDGVQEIISLVKAQGVEIEVWELIKATNVLTQKFSLHYLLPRISKKKTDDLYKTMGNVFRDVEKKRSLKNSQNLSS